MTKIFLQTISAITDSIVRELCIYGDKKNTHTFDTVVQFLADQHTSLPGYLQFPFKCLVLIFDAWTIPLFGRPFHKLSHIHRWRQIQTWKESKLGFCRDLIRFFETLVVFGWYSEVYGQVVSTS